MQKIGRDSNKPCACGSKKKFKYCCAKSVNQKIQLSTEIDDDGNLSFEKGPEYDRDGPFSINFEEGAGEVKFMYSLDGDINAMELFKADCYARIKTPERIDPKRLNKVQRPQKKVIHDYGSANPILARIYIQAVDTFNQFHLGGTLDESKSKQGGLAFCLRKASEELLACERIQTELSGKIQVAKKSIKHSKEEAVEVPSTANLDVQVANYLKHLYQFLRWIIKACNYLWNFEKDFDKPHFNTFLAWAEKNLDKDDPIISILRGSLENWIEPVIEMRNATEHEHTTAKLTVSDFELTPEGFVLEPQLDLEGKTSKREFDHGGNLEVCLENLSKHALEFGELLILLSIIPHIDGVMNKAPIQTIFKEIPEEERDKEMPLRYKKEFICTDPNLFK